VLIPVIVIGPPAVVVAGPVVAVGGAIVVVGGGIWALTQIDLNTPDIGDGEVATGTTRPSIPAPDLQPPRRPPLPQTDGDGPPTGTTTTTIPRGPCATNSLTIDDGQFGAKVGKHAQDFGLDPKDPVARAQIRSTIESIHASPDEIRQGAWNPNGGGGPDYCFYRQGDDVVVTRADGTFVTVLKGGVGNGWFRGATG
jgi:hypothetical protein